MAIIMSENEYESRMAALKAKYPSQFHDRLFDVFVCPGWMPIFETLCAQIDVALRAEDKKITFRWTQVKEKFGTLRAYYEGQPIRIDLQASGKLIESYEGPSKGGAQHARLRAISELIQEAERLSSMHCLWCGAPGKLITKGWYVTACEEHEDMTWKDAWPPGAARAQ